MKNFTFFQQSGVFFVRIEQHVCLIFENMESNKIYAELLMTNPVFYRFFFSHNNKVGTNSHCRF